MRKLALLTLFLTVLVPLKARAFNTTTLNPADDTLAYVAMPLAVSDVCAVRGVQTDQVASLTAYMDQAQVSPEGFIDVFRYAPVALVYGSGRRPDFVQWVGTQVSDGVAGDQLVTVMERQLQTYGGDVVSAPRTYRRHYYEPRYYEPDYYDVAFESDYVPIGVRRYCERELLDPFALIDMPVAVADVCDLGVPYDRVGRLVVQLDLGDVEPWQTVELLRYAPPALLVSDFGQPDFAQYVYDQRVGGLSGYALVQITSQRLLTYNVVPQIDPVPQVYTGRTAFAPVAQNYVSPIDATTFVPPVVRTRIASGVAPGSGFQQPLAAPAGAPVAAPSPQVTRLLGERGSGAVVSNPGQARRELAQTTRAEREATRGTYVPPTGFPVAQTPQNFRERGGHMVPVGGAAVAPAQSNFTAARGGEGRHGRGAAPEQFRTFNPPTEIQHAPPPQTAIESRHGLGNGHEHVAGPRTFVAPPPQVMEPRGGRHIESGPQEFAPPRAVERHVEQHHEVAQPRAVEQPKVVAQPNFAPPPPPPPQQHGHGGGPPPQAVVAAPPPQPAAQANGRGQAGPPPGKPQDEKKKGKDH